MLLLIHITARARRQQLAAAFDALVVVLLVDQRQAERLATGHRRRLARASAVAMLRSWAGHVEALMMARGQAGRLAAAWCDRRLAVVFGVWVAFGGQRTRWRASLAPRLRATRLGRVWQGWTWVVAAARRRSAVGSYAVARRQ